MEMDRRNVHSEREDRTVIVDIKDKNQDIPQQKRDLKDKLQTVSSISELRCIYRVPKHLRDANEAAYVPRIVSLGPFHHGMKGLEAMEEHKLRCFESFIKEHKIDLDALLMLMKGHEEETRKYYADRIELPSDHFVQVILVDAIFVINHLLLEVYPSASAVDVGSIYHKDFFSFQVFRDMMLLENQLPLFILVEILDFARKTNGTGIPEHCSVAKLFSLFINRDMAEEGVTDLDRYNNARHLVDFQRLFYQPQKARSEGIFKEIKRISKLHKAGVRFNVASEKRLLDIKFEKGALEIPGIVVDDQTETIFRNLLAYEQCHHCSSYITDYFVLMGMLIDTADDVDLLVKNNILQNDLATAQEVSKVFNNLEKEVIYQDPFYYSDCCDQINKYCEIPWHKWMAALKQNYLNTPWKVISVIAAFILLVLTMIQTVCSVISL